jgi:hypothetical protein
MRWTVGWALRHEAFHGGVEHGRDRDAQVRGFGAHPRRKLGRRVPAEQRRLVLPGHQAFLVFIHASTATW